MFHRDYERASDSFTGIIPRPKYEKYFENCFYSDRSVSVYAPDVNGRKALEAMKLMVPGVEFTLTAERKDAGFFFECDMGISEKSEYYILDTRDGKARLYYRDFLGARNGAAAVSQIISVSRDRFTVPRCVIEDWPDCSYRGYMLDPARKIVGTERLKEYLILLSRAKYNVLHMHLSDEQGYCIKSDIYPQIPGAFGEQYSKEEIRDIVRFAGVLGIQVIPEFDIPAHMNMIISAIPELGCVCQDPSPWALCVGNEYTYEVIGNILFEITELFPCDTIHIGGDEIAMTDLKKLHTWPSWDECERCRELRTREGLGDITEIYYYFLRRVYDIVSGLGKKMMLWNDNIDISTSPDLPRDILIEFWRVAGTSRGPNIGCSMERFLEEGFEVVNAFYEETYFCGYVKPERLEKWNPRSNPEICRKYERLVTGGEACAWGGDRHSYYPRVIPSSIFLFGERLWSNTPVSFNSSYLLSLTMAVLGPTCPSGFDLFRYFGTPLPPQKDDIIKLRDAAGADEECRQVLVKILGENSVYSQVAGDYLACLF